MLTKSTLSKPVVAVIEDHTDCQELMRILLADYCHVRCFSSVPAALNQIRIEPPDLILTDLLLPDTSGWNLPGELRVRGLSIPVVAVSALVVRGIREQVLAAGFSEFVAKPITEIEELGRLIRRLTRSDNAA